MFKQQGFAVMFLKESASDNLPKEAVGKSAKTVAALMKNQLVAAGLKLIDAAPIKDDKTAIWTVESEKHKGKTVVLNFTSRSNGKLLYLSFNIYEGGEKTGPASLSSAMSYSGIGKIYKEQIK